MENRTTGLHPEKYKFSLSHFDSTISYDERAMFEDIFGKEGAMVATRYAEGSDRKPNKTTIDIVEKNSLSSLQEAFGISDTEMPRFISQSYDIAAQTIENLIQTMAPTERLSLEMNNRVDMYRGENLSTLIKLLTNPSNPRMRFEAERQSILAYYAGAIMRKHELLGLRQLADEIEESFQTHLYKKEPHLEVSLYSQHSMASSDLNALGDVTILPEEVRARDNYNWKQTPFALRETQDNELVYTHGRIKNTTETLLKLLRKAANNGGELDMDYVEDPIGIMFVHFGKIENGIWRPPTTEDTTAFIDRTIDTLANEHPIYSYTEDDDVDIDNNQSPSHSYRRRQVYREGTTVNGHNTPIELICYTPDQYINSRYHIGTSNSAECYSGPAHKLYQWKRSREVMRRLFPEDIYNRTQLELAMQNQQSRIVGDLLIENTYQALDFAEEY